MKVNADEEKGCAVGVKVSDESAVVYVSADVGDGGEGCGNVGGVMHGEEKACNNL